MGKPHGLRGEVYVEVVSDDPRRFEVGAQLLSEDGSLRVIETVRPHGQRLLVKFDGAETREAAELLRGPLYVAGSDVRALEEGEFWDHELIGCEVVGEDDGAPLGRVSDVVHGPAHDLLVVDTERGERLVPVVKEIVLRIDTTGRTVKLEPSYGLLD